MMRKTMKTLLVTMVAATLMVGCGSKTTSDTKSVTDEKQYTIGIAQFAVHGSLDNCREGFIKGLESEGIKEGKNLTIIYENANADGGTGTQIIDNFTSKKVDMVCAIATPMAQSAFVGTKNTEIPVIYTAVTDPVAAQLATEDKKSLGNITGTSDKLPVEEQLKMIRTLLPEAKKIGIMYSTSEVNSVAAIEEYKTLARNYNFEIVESGISSTSDIPLAADDLLKKVDCINNLTDNTVVSSLPIILDKAKKAKVPVFGSEVEQVKIGCLGAMGLDYVALGEQTGKMAAKVLKSEAKASDIPFEVIENASFYGNQAVADELGLPSLEETIDQVGEIFTTIEK